MPAKLSITSVMNLSHGTRTNGTSIIKSINQLSADYPARSVKLKYVGTRDKVLEIITARAFTDSSGNLVKRYGKTRITLNSSKRILSISDDLYPEETTEHEIKLSPGYTLVPYHKKAIISNTVK